MHLGDLVFYVRAREQLFGPYVCWEELYSSHGEPVPGESMVLMEVALPELHVDELAALYERALTQVLTREEVEDELRGLVLEAAGWTDPWNVPWEPRGATSWLGELAGDLLGMTGPWTHEQQRWFEERAVVHARSHLAVCWLLEEVWEVAAQEWDVRALWRRASLRHAQEVLGYLALAHGAQLVVHPSCDESQESWCTSLRARTYLMGELAVQLIPREEGAELVWWGARGEGEDVVMCCKPGRGGIMWRVREGREWREGAVREASPMSLARVLEERRPPGSGVCPRHVDGL